MSKRGDESGVSNYSGFIFSYLREAPTEAEHRSAIT